MQEEMLDLKLRIIALKEEISKYQNQLFNAFSLARPEVLQKDPPYDFEYMRTIADEFYKYLDELEAMGKHKLYAG